MSNTPRSFRLPGELWAAVDAAAGAAGQSRTLFVRRALEEALGGRVGASRQGVSPSEGPDVLTHAPVPSPRASAAKNLYGTLDPALAAVESRRGKRAGGFVPRPKKGG